MASKVVEFFEGKHKDVKVSPEELRLIKLWVDTGAHFPGTYAALGSGVIAGRIDQSDPTPPALLPKEAAFVQQNCDSCHWKRDRDRPEDLKKLDKTRFPSRVLHATNVNLTRPELSRVLLAPLAEEAGGLGLCERAVFESKEDDLYRELLSIVQGLAEQLEENKRYTMDGFVPNEHYIREMKRYGALDPGYEPGDPVDWFEVDDRYFRLFWYEPPKD
jgi:hypothetical protein